jgi:hypothetical protein
MDLLYVDELLLLPKWLCSYFVIFNTFCSALVELAPEFVKVKTEEVGYTDSAVTVYITPALHRNDGEYLPIL